MNDNRLAGDWARAQTIFTLFTALISLALFVVISKVDKPLQNELAPRGIVSFELAKKFDNSQTIIKSWDNRQKQYAAFSLGIDYLFLIAYSLLLAALIVKISRALAKRFKRLARLGYYLAMLQFAAAALDAVENFFLAQILFGSSRLWFSQYAFFCAALKFIIVAAGLAYILSGLLLLSIGSMSRGALPD